MKRFECFGLDTANECLCRNGELIALAPKPFAVLRYLVDNPGRLITHDEMLDALWPDTFVQPQVLRTYMQELRKVLGDDAGQPRFIQTVPKRGYRFVAQITESGETKPPGPQPTASQAAREPGIVGREQELARLHEQLRLLADGRRRMVLITGESGIGKTALVDAFCRPADGWVAARLARGQCVQGVGGKEPYYPVMEALAQLCAAPDGEMACRTLARMAPAWLVRGREPEPAAPAQPPAAQARMVGELCGALEELAAQKPLILVFEDLHWADEATLDLISALARRRAAAQLMVLATCMPRKAPPELPLKVLMQDLHMRRLSEEIALAPLARPAVRQLLCAQLGQESVSPELVRFVYQHSEGNPLFVAAVLMHLIAEGFLARRQVDGAPLWDQCAPFPEFSEMEARVPTELAQMIELEIDRLSLEEQRLLEAGSLMTVAFPAWAVAAALRTDVAETEEACDALARRLHFMQRAGQDVLPDGARSAFYVFAHGLYREVLYHRQAASRRARRHIRIAERLGELFAGREAIVAREMSMHFEAAAEWRGAADTLRCAARHALQSQSGADAAELLDQALRIARNLGGTERDEAVREILQERMAACEAMKEGPEIVKNVPEKV